MTLFRSTPKRRVRGAVILGVTLVLFAATLLATWFASGGLLLEQRMGAKLARSAQAFEAAEAGLDWALAMLNANRGIDDACEPSADPTASSFRTRSLTRQPATGVLLPTGLAAVCTFGGEQGWMCRCPAPRTPAIAPGAPGAPGAPEGATFRVAFLSSGRPEVIRVSAVGCTSPDGDCYPGSTSTPDAVAHHQTAYALLSALPSPPVAAVTLRGAFDAANAPLGLRNSDPATGIAVHAGGRFDAPLAHVIGPPGTSAATLIADQDAALAQSTPDRFFASHFGVDRLGWKNLPTIRRLVCALDCGTAITSMVAAAGDIAAIQIEGDLNLAGPLTLGSPAHPVLLVASGAINLEGDIALHGVLHGASLRWNRTGGGAFVRGALLLETDYAGGGAPLIVRDAAVLETLAHDSGGFARVPGAWRDF